MKRVLITGGAGYIGSHTARALSLEGYAPIIYDNLSTGHREFARFGEFIKGDIRDTPKLTDVMRSHRIDSVLHFAASAYVGESMHYPLEYFDNNVRGTLSLLDAMKQAGVSRLIFSSSCATYGNPASIPIKESDPQHPLSPYGESKLSVERLLPFIECAHGIQWIALRFFNAAGAALDGTLGERHSPETHLIPNLIRAAQESQPVRIFGWDYPTGDGTTARDYVHVSDIATAHILGLKYLERGQSSTALNLGSGRSHTILEIVTKIEQISGKQIIIERSERRAGDASVLVADIAKAMSMLAWRPEHSDLDSIVSSAWNWHVQHG